MITLPVTEIKDFESDPENIETQSVWMKENAEASAQDERVPLMKKSYLVLALILILAVISTQYSNKEPAETADTVLAATEAAPTDSVGDENNGSNSKDGNHNNISSDNNYSWGNPNTLQDHFERHGGDFNATDAQDYAQQAHTFYLNRDAYQVKTQDGVARVYDAETNTFGAYNSNGTTRTFYKPSGGQAYFDRQPGS